MPITDLDTKALRLTRYLRELAEQEFHDAADLLDAQAARIGELEEALKPFAGMAYRLDRDAGGPFPDKLPLGVNHDLPSFSRPNVGDLRRARAVLERKP